jgi:glycine hydroxymethyltransferase
MNRNCTLSSSLGIPSGRPNANGSTPKCCEIADSVGGKVLFDAARLCGLIAGGVWPNPLDQNAHLMSMSTYKSLGGPPGGLLLANDAELAQRIEAIAYPGRTANFDAGKTAALAQMMLD